MIIENVKGIVGRINQTFPDLLDIELILCESRIAEMGRSFPIIVVYLYKDIENMEGDPDRLKVMKDLDRLLLDLQYLQNRNFSLYFDKFEKGELVNNLVEDIQRRGIELKVSNRLDSTHSIVREEGVIKSISLSSFTHELDIEYIMSDLNKL